MNISIFSYTKKGLEKSLHLKGILKDYIVKLYTPEKFAGASSDVFIYPEEDDFYKNQFISKDALIFIGAAGIAVRKIAPYIRSKATDPAVLVIDDGLNFVIPILSGHIGGGNRLASYIAEKSGAQAVLTTATDVNRIFAVDTWASEKGFAIYNIEMIKEISGALLNGESVGFYSDYPVTGALPKGLRKNGSELLGVTITYKDLNRFSKDLFIIPKGVSVGIGCRRNTNSKTMEDFFTEMLEKNHIFPESIASIASIDLKKDEQCLLDLSKKYKIPLTFYTSEELSSAEGDFAPSAFVKSITGVDNVCQRSASLASKDGKQLVGKTSKDGMTFSAYLENIIINFGGVR